MTEKTGMQIPVEWSAGMDEKQTEKSRFSIKEAFLNWVGLFLVLVAAIVAYMLITNLGKIIGIVRFFFSILKPVLYGCVIAYLVNPLCKIYQRLLRKLAKKQEKELSPKMKRMIDSLSIAFGLLTGILVIAILCRLVLPQLFTSISSMVDTLPKQVNYYYHELTDWVEGNPFLADQMQKALLQMTDYFDTKMNSELFPWLQRVLLPNVNTYAMQFANGVMSFMNVLYNLFIGLIVAIYILGGKREFLAQAKKILYGMLRKEHADIVAHYVQLTNQMFSGFIAGKIVDSTIIGLICFVFMWILHLPYALLVSVIVGVTNIIPVFGPYIGAIPSFLLILLVSPVQALYFLILVIILQQADGNIIGPAILGESTGLSAFWVLFAILLFGGLWGLFGMLVGVPLFAVIYQMIKDIVHARLRYRQLPTLTEHYIDLKEIAVGEEGVTFVKYSEEELLEKKKKNKNKDSAFMQRLREVWQEKNRQPSASEKESGKQGSELAATQRKDKE